MRQLKQENVAENEEDQQSDYLLFSLGGELYGSPLLSIREVIKSNLIKSVPYMVPHFRGVINLRGQIISVVDLRIKFALPHSNAGLILIVESPNGLLGAVIDDLISVQPFLPTDIEKPAQLETKIPIQFFLGVAKLSDRLVNLIDIAGSLSTEELRLLSPREGT